MVPGHPIPSRQIVVERFQSQWVVRAMDVYDSVAIARLVFSLLFAVRGPPDNWQAAVECKESELGWSKVRTSAVMTLIY